MDPTILRGLQELCFLDRDNIYGARHYGEALLDGFSNRLGGAERDPFIGFIGRRYSDSRIKVLVIGRANAQSSKEHRRDDLLINRNFQNFKSAVNDCERELYYREYSCGYSRAMPKWRIFQNFIKYFLSDAGLKLQDIAYVNAVPFRYGNGVKSKPTSRHYEVAFREFTNIFISLIRPDLILPLGKNDDQTILRYLNIQDEPKIFRGVKRTNSDRYLCRDGMKDLDEAVQTYFEMMQVSSINV